MKKKIMDYKGFIIASGEVHDNYDFYVFTKDEWRLCQYDAEFECCSIKECKENIDSYEVENNG